MNFKTIVTDSRSVSSPYLLYKYTENLLSRCYCKEGNSTISVNKYSVKVLLEWIVSDWMAVGPIG